MFGAELIVLLLVLALAGLALLLLVNTSARAEPALDSTQGPIRLVSSPAGTASAPIPLGPPRRLVRDGADPAPLPARRPLIHRGAPLVLRPVFHPLWQIKGWRQSQGKHEYMGNYTAAGRTYRGLIVQPYPKKYEAYIWHPPLRELEHNTHHRPCFSSSPNGGPHKVHFTVEPGCLDHAIVNVELVLEQALKGGTL